MFVSDTEQPPAMNHARWLLLAPLGEIGALRLDVVDAAKTIAAGFNRTSYAYYAWLDPRNWTKEEQIKMLDSAFSPEASDFAREWELIR